MSRKLMVVLFFVFVFGFPITWYLILQLFGENQFELPVIGEVNRECIHYSETPVLIAADSFLLGQNFNLNKRISNKLATTTLNIPLLNKRTCLGESDIYLIDSLGRVRGEFLLNREDVDRLMAEIDIFVLNMVRNSRNK